MTTYYQKRREKDVEETRKWRRDSYQRNKHKELAKKKADRAAKLLALAGRPKSPICEICGTECETVWDHCHKTGKFRGWLCAHCNRTIGFIENHPGRVYKMHLYIQSHYQ